MFDFIKNLFSKGKAQTVKVVDIANADLNLKLEKKDENALKACDKNIVVGKILEIRKHKNPKITKVQVTKCLVGEGKEEQILCGGSNIEVGQIVPVAQVGANLGGGFIIGERDIRGEVSRGMICSREELGLSMPESEKGGIWGMPSDFEVKLGTPVKDLV